MNRPRVIAFYLPQYYPTPHNDEWYGKGFTEWTNVAKAKKLYPGHYQPKIPADLGFYDLRLPEVREQQVVLAQEAGIEGFCYYHYWFENGKEELDRQFKEVLASGKPDFPFCLCWANESWYRKLWNYDGSIIDKQVLVEQKYLGREDNIEHFYALLNAFKDPRYLRIDGKPIFMIYKAEDFVGIEEFINLWNLLAIENGLEGIFFIAYTLDVKRQYQRFKEMGFDAVCSYRIGEHVQSLPVFYKFIWFVKQKLKFPRIYDYKKELSFLVGEEERKEDVFPTLVPNWDHTPRSGRGGFLYENCTPELFEKHADQVFSIISEKPEDKQICFLKSWNEWGEGNYMEPDLKYRKGYINALKKTIIKFEK